ncbi:hypothetical protein AAZX31_09G045300 [Glycine max]|uniref:Uncharacterized protein n=2 Tax=Glycine subgen. Soja TaxID=1462606 RepID=I1L113_SOYBN|nr:uncharacterized protein LOC100806944 [Glycine max]XP_028179673.1 uncharacterized protein LOC114366858 [Glycine soja]KAG5006044.1 hypothetical protein JHK85_024586 [Glycine max]KAG5011838.1 hypothetical protein JHK86_024099 [Glycine max]KAG5132835.1 hypothetical protein JHK82_024023 [Glycine max]KAH1041471.1 hypothetical protein GYH30_024036 [Glycine max]KAH1231979.1 hypothetical protein GmHk_09G024747 [Glycine max]|eukprot:XP_003533433.1 uncharacterized protein LOC100806944 [Glycine max]
MGQAFRRASGRIRAASEADTSSFSKPKNAVDRRPPPNAAADKAAQIPKAAEHDVLHANDSPRVNTDNILEERDPKFDAMLGQMIGRITSKPEMGEAFVVDKYNRPMPKLRNTKPDSGRYDERPVPAGTLNVAQLRHVILLHEGKADDYNGRMDAHQIAEKFRVDVVQIQRILQFLSQPPEGSSKDKNKAPR